MSPKWIKRFLQLARMISTWSKDPTTKVGAVIVDPDKTVLSLGYNGFPRNVPDYPELYEDRDTKRMFVLHAEINAILNARGRDLRGSLIFITHPPCSACARAIAQAGISSVYILDQDLHPDWRSELQAAQSILEHAGIAIHRIPISDIESEDEWTTPS